MNKFTSRVDLRPQKYKRIPRKLKKALKKQFPLVMNDSIHSVGTKLWYAQSYNHPEYHDFRINALIEALNLKDTFEVGSAFWVNLTNNGERKVPQFLIRKDIIRGVEYTDYKYGQVFRISDTTFKVKYT